MANIFQCNENTTLVFEVPEYAMDYNDDIRQEQMWEMQVLSNQKNVKGDDSNIGDSQNEISEDRLSEGDAVDTDTQNKDNSEHPAMRGIQTESMAPETLEPAKGESQSSPTSAETGGPIAAAAALATRKRPLLAGGPRTSMTPTKRTVMSLLARARAAQAKQLPGVTGATAFTRGVSVFEERAPTLVPLLREDYMSAVNLNLI